MNAIIISACLLSDPSICKDHRLPVDMAIDQTSCSLFAPPHFAQWAEEHPQWKIVRWKCQPASLNDI